MGWHQPGSHIRLKVVIRKLWGQPWPPDATLLLKRSGYTGSTTLGPYPIPPDVPGAESVDLMFRTAFELSAEGHYTISLRLGDQTREIVRFNALPAGLAMIGIPAALFALVAAVASVVTLFLID